MIFFQLCLYCALFFLMVRLGAAGGGIRELFFYPEEYRKIAYARGLADEAETRRSRKRFMIPFLSVMFAALVLIDGLWNRPADMRTAYLQCLLFLQVMNWFDGIVIDELWVGLSPLWRISGMEGIPYRKPWPVMLRMRALTSAVFAVLAFIPAAAALMISNMAGAVH